MKARKLVGAETCHLSINSHTERESQDQSAEVTCRRLRRCEVATNEQREPFAETFPELPNQFSDGARNNAERGAKFDDATAAVYLKTNVARVCMCACVRVSMCACVHDHRRRNEASQSTRRGEHCLQSVCHVERVP